MLYTSTAQKLNFKKVVKILKCLGAKIHYGQLVKCLTKVRPGSVVDMVMEVLLCTGQSFPYDKVKTCVDKYKDALTSSDQVGV